MPSTSGQTRSGNLDASSRIDLQCVSHEKHSIDDDQVANPFSTTNSATTRNRSVVGKIPESSSSKSRSISRSSQVQVTAVDAERLSKVHLTLILCVLF
jgi:hypothetical protein